MSNPISRIEESKFVSLIIKISALKLIGHVVAGVCGLPSVVYHGWEGKKGAKVIGAA